MSWPHAIDLLASMCASLLPGRNGPVFTPWPRAGVPMRFSRPGLVLVSSLLLAGISPLPTACPAMAGSPNGVAGSMPAYYDHDLFTINFKQMVTAQDILQAKNGQLNIIWQSDPGLPGGQPFI